MRPGEIVGQYRLVAELGRGGMGQVFTAEPVGGDGLVVIKGILRDDASNPDVVRQMRSRFRREADIQLQLRHENIVRALDWLELEDEWLLVLEHVEGLTLEEWLTKKPPLRERLTVLRGVVEGIVHAHSMEVVHRDLKPANVIVTPDLVAKVLDFGLAKMVDSTRLTQTGIIMGTLSYMAPEQAWRGDADERADLYSIGMMLARVLGCRRPFPSAREAVTLKHLDPDAPVPLDDWLPRPAREALEQLLAKNRDERTARAEECAALIDELIAGADELESELRRARAATVKSQQAPLLPAIERPELARAVDELVTRAGTGRGGGTLALGPPGSGKSRSLDACAERLRAAGVQAVRLAFPRRGPEQASFLEWLRQRDAEESRSEDEETATAIAHPSPLEVIDRVLAEVQLRSRCDATAVLIDDVHFASPGSLAQLEALLASTADSPLLVVLAGDIAREGGGPRRAAAYGAFLARCAASQQCGRVVLEPLGDEALSEALGELPLNEPMRERIRESCAGNPELANALLAHWHEGTLDDAEAEPPKRIARRLERRWKALTPAAKATLRFLTAGDGEQDVAELCERTKLKPLHVLSALRELSVKHGWVTLDETRARARHPYLAWLVAQETYVGGP